MNRLGFAIILTLATVAPASAVSPNPKELLVSPADLGKARELVRRLGSDAFSEREQAQSELARMGRLAKAVIAEAAVADPDPEVRSRCRVLMPNAIAADLKARLDAFLADAAGKYDHDLPAWSEFGKVIGTTRAARELFVAMLADPANRSLVMAVGGAANDLGQQVYTRRQEMYQWRFPRTPGAVRREASAVDVATLLFAESHVASRLIPRGVNTSVMLSTPAITAAVNESGEKGATYRALLVHWVTTRDDPVQMYSAMTVATNFGLKECAGVAAKLLGTGGATVFYRGQAAMTLARLEARAHLGDLEKHLTDESVLTTLRRTVNGQVVATEIQLRDVALAAALLLTGQMPEDYGYTEQYKGSSGARYSYSAYQLPADKRAAALGKWKAWRAKNADFEKTDKK